MNDSILLLSSPNNRFVDSLVQPQNTLCCGGVEFPESLTIHPSCFDWSGFCIAVFACIIAIVTCLFTILMYLYVKKQLDLAETQFREQIEENKTNEQARNKSMNDTKNYVGEIKLQIINNSLINLVEKKQRFLQDYDYLYEYLSENSAILKEGPVIQKNEKLRTTINNIVINLCLINDILALFDKQNERLESLFNTINKYFENFKNIETIASDMDGIDAWLDEFNNTKIGFSEEVEEAISQIKKEINKNNNE